MTILFIQFTNSVINRWSYFIKNKKQLKKKIRKKTKFFFIKGDAFIHLILNNYL